DFGMLFFFSSRRRHTRFSRDWSSDVCSSDLWDAQTGPGERHDKKIIQPFGEYLPWRSFFRLFSEYADRAGHFVPGDGDGMVTAEIGRAACRGRVESAGVGVAFEG